MLGKTNALFIPGAESAPAQLVAETVLTVSAESIEKIECINGMYFAFLGDGKVLHGSDINNLGILTKENEALMASHAIYADDQYYFVCAGEAAVVYASQDLESFEDITIMSGYKMAGLYKSSRGGIVALAYQESSSKVSSMYLLAVDTLNGYQKDTADPVKVNCPAGVSLEKFFLRKSCIIRDRIILSERTGTGSGTVKTAVISLDGSHVLAASNYSYYAHGYFYSVVYQNTSMTLYYSVNGVDYSYLGSIDQRLENFHLIEFEDGVTGIFFSQKFAITETPAKLIESLEKATETNIFGTIYTGTSNEGYTYIGCSGGVILKTYVDYSGNANTPNVTVLKTLSARQALDTAKAYTDTKIKELEARIALLEEGGSENM